MCLLVLMSKHSDCGQSMIQQKYLQHCVISLPHTWHLLPSSKKSRLPHGLAALSEIMGNTSVTQHDHMHTFVASVLALTEDFFSRKDAHRDVCLHLPAYL